MTSLLLHGTEVPTVFDLLGRDENDMTYALGWGLARSPTLQTAFMRLIGLEPVKPEDLVVRLQQYEGRGGYTDIELGSEKQMHAIIEAKRGWWLPSRAQLDRYEQRLRASGAQQTRMVVLTQWGAESAARHAIKAMGLVYECDVVGWSDVLRMLHAARRGAPRVERPWLDELGRYLSEVTDMRDTDSNSVFVVSLAHQRGEGWQYDFVEIVTKLGKYFFPASGKNWPKVPPNYIAFRYGGLLQSIHHIDDYAVVTHMADHLPVPPPEWDPHFLVTLGPPIKPPQRVPTGPRIHRSGHAWVDIDLLLTAPTISDALTLTEQRRRT
jgi:hypothetical protein